MTNMGGKGLETVGLKYKIKNKNKVLYSSIVRNPPLGFTLQATPVNETHNRNNPLMGKLTARLFTGPVK